MPGSRSEDTNSGIEGQLRLSNSLFRVAIMFILVAPYLSLWLYYSQTRKNVDSQFFELVRATAVITASQIDPEAHARLVREQDVGGPDYVSMMAVLVSIHRSEPLIYYLVTMIERDNLGYIILDTANEISRDSRGNPLVASGFMDIYPDASTQDQLAYAAIRNGQPYVLRVPYTDEFGTFVGACAPLAPWPNADNSMVCVDIQADTYMEQIDSLKRNSFLVTALTAFLSLGLVWGLLKIRRFVSTSIASMEKQRDLYQKLSHIDPLTGALNRRAFEETFRASLAELKRYGTHFALIVLDLDLFKNINDSFGHDTGDKVLISIVKNIASVLRDTDRLARLGGEEFGAICRVNSQDQAMVVGEKIRQCVAGIDDVTENNGEGLRFTTSVGVYMVQPDDNMDSAIKAADLALYQAKENGRNRVVLYQATGQAGFSK